MPGGENKTSIESTGQEEFKTDVSPALASAADKLEVLGKHHGWFNPGGLSWREADPIGQGEYLAVVQDIVDAYNTAPAQGA